MKIGAFYFCPFRYHGSYMRYELALEQFQGPLEKLLELIETEKLKISEVSLARVTEGFLRHITELKTKTDSAISSGEQANARILAELLADFLAIASKLIFIKSKSLIPSEALPEEDSSDTRSLEARLALYRDVRGTSVHIRSLWHETPVLGARAFLASVEPIFFPSTTLTAPALADAAARIVGALEKFFQPTARVKNEVINLTAKIEEIIHRIAHEPQTFDALRTTQSRGELVVLFLAILHLVKERTIDVTQGEAFSNFTIARSKSIKYDTSENSATTINEEHLKS